MFSCHLGCTKTLFTTKGATGTGGHNGMTSWADQDAQAWDQVGCFRMIYALTTLLLVFCSLSSCLVSVYNLNPLGVASRSSQIRRAWWQGREQAISLHLRAGTGDSLGL